MKNIKLWKSPEHISITDAMHHLLIEHYFGLPLTQAMDFNGNIILGSIHVIDGSVVRGVVEGSVARIDSEGTIITRERIIRSTH